MRLVKGSWMPQEVERMLIGVEEEMESSTSSTLGSAG